MTTLVVIAKSPRPGHVKTRLTPPLTPVEAARVAEAALADTLHAVAGAPATRRVLVLDGPEGPWLPGGFEVAPQCAGDLDVRLAHAFSLCEGPTLLVGMDTPQVTAGLLTLDHHEETDAWFGPAADGGFWALGLRRPDPSLLLGIPMSRRDTGARQRARLVAAGLKVRDLVTLTDVDTVGDLRTVCEQAPATRCAALARGLPAGVWAGAR